MFIPCTMQQLIYNVFLFLMNICEVPACACEQASRTMPGIRNRNITEPFCDSKKVSLAQQSCLLGKSSEDMKG